MKQKIKSLLLTLGHNSSAIAMDSEGNILAGYENERLTKRKSDSSFPVEAINEILKHYDREFHINVFVSHWFQNFQLPVNKYCNMAALDFLGNYSLYAVNENFTHHDAHAYSGLWFAGSEVEPGTAVFVFDGFGNNGEVFSKYICDGSRLDLQARSFDFMGSLGLWYQYTTAYLGYKENQDEYKLLGLAAQVTSEAWKFFRDDVVALTNYLSTALRNLNKDYIKRSVVALDAAGLAAVRNHVYGFWDTLVKKHEKTPGFEMLSATYIAYVLQLSVESVLVDLCKHDGPKIFVGGVFYNVGANGQLLVHSTKDCLFVPLAGDQGAALGLYKYYNPKSHFDSNLCWGKRDLTQAKNWSIPGIVYADKLEDVASRMISNIVSGKIVNLVRGAMEFGPRALCNTSTLALPTMKNVDSINAANSRATVMPMAPVMTDKFAWKNLHNESLAKLAVTSARNMICAVKVKNQKGMEGACLNVQYSGNHTARPQVLYGENDTFYRIVDACGGVLINTSFNVHGQPIVFNLDDVVYNHEIQRQTLGDNLITYIIGE